MCLPPCFSPRYDSVSVCTVKVLPSSSSESSVIARCAWPLTRPDDVASRILPRIVVPGGTACLPRTQMPSLTRTRKESPVLLLPELTGSTSSTATTVPFGTSSSGGGNGAAVFFVFFAESGTAMEKERRKMGHTRLELVTLRLRGACSTIELMARDALRVLDNT